MVDIYLNFGNFHLKVVNENNNCQNMPYAHNTMKPRFHLSNSPRGPRPSSISPLNGGDRHGKHAQHWPQPSACVCDFLIRPTRQQRPFLGPS